MHIGGEEVRRNLRCREQHGQPRYTVKREEWGDACVEVCVHEIMC